MPTAPLLAPERDLRAKRGRPKRSGVTYYSIPGCGFQAGSTVVVTAGRDAYEPFYADTPIVIDQLAFEVTTLAAGNMRVGIYRADRDLQPIGAPLTDSGDISTNTTGVKTFTPGTPLFLGRGPYLGVSNCDVGPTLRTQRVVYLSEGIDTTLGGNIVHRFEATRAYAAFPTPGAAWTVAALATTSADARLFFRVLTP